MRVTRKSKPAAGSDTATTQVPASALPPSSSNPPMLFILPQNRTQDARIVSLPDPASGKETRYFFDPALGLYEFVNISNPRNAPSSWLLAPESPSKNTEVADAGDQEHAKGYTVEQPSLFVATQMDTSFLILPALLSGLETESRQLFLTTDDYLEKVATQSKDLAQILGQSEILSRLEERLKGICDKVEAGEDSMYRVNMAKLAKYLIGKAERMVSAGLPASMEQKFVREALQAPATINEISAMENAPAESQSTDAEPASQSTPALLSEAASFSSTTSLNPDSQDSQVSNTSAATSATSIAEETSNPEIEQLLRLRTALNFLLVSYIQPSFHTILRTAINEPASGLDFTPLDAHLRRIDELKKEAQALRSLSDNISRKRRTDDDEAAELRAEKKRKKEEEDAKKKAQSRAIKQLAKTNTSGMKKMSSFFTKAPPKQPSS